jgi:hypothetical protein
VGYGLGRNAARYGYGPETGAGSIAFALFASYIIGYGSIKVINTGRDEGSLTTGRYAR